MTSTTNHRPKHPKAPRPGSPSSVRMPSAGAPSRLVLLAVAGCLAGAAALSACTGSQPGPAASTAVSSSTPPASAAAPSTAPTQGAAAQASGSAEGNPATATLKQTLADALNRLAAGTPKPATAQVADALTGAGIPGTALEVSESRTPTGLEADAIEAAVLAGRGLRHRTDPGRQRHGQRPAGSCERQVLCRGSRLTDECELSPPTH